MDTDDLTDLTKLFTVVGREVHMLVVIGTAEVATRKWPHDIWLVFAGLGSKPFGFRGLGSKPCGFRGLEVVLGAFRLLFNVLYSLECMFIFLVRLYRNGSYWE